MGPVWVRLWARSWVRSWVRHQRDHRLLAQLPLEDLARRGARQRRVGHAQIAGHLEACQVLEQEGAHRLRVHRRAAVHRGAHLLAQALVGHRVHRRLVHVGMHQQRSLHLAAADVLSTADDQVLDAIDDEQVALVVEIGDVAGAEPPVFEHAGIDLGPVPVADEHRRAAHQQFAALAGRQFGALLVDNLQLQHRRAAPGARRARQVLRAADAGADRVGLGHAPAGIRHRLREHRIDSPHLLGRARRAAAAHHHQRREVVSARSRNTHQVAGDRRRPDEGRDPLSLDQRRGLLGVPLVHADDLALRPVAGEVDRVRTGHVEQRDAEQRGGLVRRLDRFDAGDQCRGLRVELPRHQRGNDAPVRRDHALRMAGGPGGVEDRRRVVWRDVGRGHRHVAQRAQKLRQRDDLARCRLAGLRAHARPGVARAVRLAGGRRTARSVACGRFRPRGPDGDHPRVGQRTAAGGRSSRS